MTLHWAPSKDLGLQHVLENGLAMVRHEPLPEGRRTQVVGSLLKIFSEADRGSEVLKTHSLTFAADEQPAFERFSAFFGYLEDTFGDTVPERLAEAKVALETLCKGDDPDAARQKRLDELLSSLLVALRRERALTPLQEPKDYSFV